MPKTITVKLTIAEAEALTQYALDDAYYGHQQRMEGVGTDPMFKEDAACWTKLWRAVERAETKINRALAAALTERERQSESEVS